ncbi:putative XK-related protein [Daphnia magna]|uniref:XK-related protein n=1 Tax=Daphnia magna TaxID=35525 RepID=A0A0P5DLP8_9CRUS|nr:putative XK-related protein [Daphnia magna]
METGNRLVLLDFLLVTVALVTLIVDFLVSGYTAYKQFYMRNYAIVAVTALLAFVPGFITSVLSCFWLARGSSQSVRPKLPTLFHVFRILSVVFLNSPVSGYVNALYYLFKRHQALLKGELEALQRSWELMAACMMEVTMLRLYFAFLNTCPQLILQIYFWLQMETKANSSEGWLDILVAMNSMISISMAATTYDRTFLQNRPDKETMRFRATVMLFFIHFFNLGARLLAISLFTSLSVEYVALLLGIHWIVMVAWLMLPVLKSSFHFEKILAIMALGVAFIFVFIKSEGSRTRRKYAFYYTISLVGNTSMMVMWFKHGSYPNLPDIPNFMDSWIYYLGLTCHYVFFFTGIVLLALYHMSRLPGRAASVEIRLSERLPN